jgi:hypothetical protein
MASIKDSQLVEKTKIKEDAEIHNGEMFCLQKSTTTKCESAMNACIGSSHASTPQGRPFQLAHLH